MNQENLRKTPSSTRDSPQSHRKVEIRCYCDYCITSEQFETDLRDKVFFHFRSRSFWDIFGLFQFLGEGFRLRIGFASPKNILRGRFLFCNACLSVPRMLPSVGKLVNSSKPMSGHRLSRAASGQRFSQEK